MRFETTLQRCTAVLLMLACTPALASVCRVSTAGTALNNGSSWGVPMSLQQALSVPQTCTEVWVAKGVYKPAAADNTVSFAIASAVAVYGGFSGSETARAERDPAANLTVLSGDVDNNDTTDSNGVDVDASHIVGSNSRHVVSMSSTNSSTVLDGFTITGGSAPGGGLSDSTLGGGVLCNCSSTFSNLIFSGNAASARGGAMYLGDGSPQLSGIVFTGNQAGVGGGAVSISTIQANTIRLSNVAFRNNQVPDNQYGAGGALSSETVGAVSVELANAEFSANVAQFGGAIFSQETTTVLSNATFSANVAGNSGAAVYLQSDAPDADVTLTNVTFTANVASNGGAAIASDRAPGSVLAVRNTILWGDVSPTGEIFTAPTGRPTIDHSIVQGSGSGAGWNANFGNDGGGNLDVDPRLGALADDRTGTRTMIPAGGSPAIDAGNSDGCPNEDQRGIVRPQGDACDIGAVETFGIDLVSHNGFGGCYSEASTPAAFLDLIRTQIEGAVTCAAPVVYDTFTACNTPACPGGAIGCPLTSRAGTFTGAFGDGSFTATGGVDNTTIPVYIASLGKTCQFDVTGITATFAPSYVFTDDGNSGDYAALLNRFVVTTAAETVSSTDGACQSGAASPAIVDLMKNTLQAGLAQKLRDATLRKSVCPLSP